MMIENILYIQTIKFTLLSVKRLICDQVSQCSSRVKEI